MNRLDQSVLNARRNLLVMFVSLCLLDFLLVIPIQDRWAIGRILLTIVVMYFTLQGKKWAKWMLVGLCSLMVVALILVVVALSSQLNFVMIIGSLILALLNALVANYMIRSKELNRYFAYKRRASS
ncbi:MAG: hypothetical protein AAFY26_12560 [Cyanobacteria bacterium J06638_22]